jgi:hypothetical protein
MEWEGKMVGAEPHPDLPCRAEFGEFLEDGAEDTRDRFVGMKTSLALLLAPHQADGQGAVQFAAGRFVADPAVESFAQGVQFCFRHSA